MKEWGSILLASGAVAAMAGSFVAGTFSWLSERSKIEKQLHITQAESGYEALVQANALSWRATKQTSEKGDSDPGAQELRNKSDDLYVSARLKIAAFGDAEIVKALSDYYYKYGGAARPCANKEKFALDTKIYSAIRNTLGVRGSVNDDQIAHVVFLCSLN
jgi:hypothetical protein